MAIRAIIPVRLQSTRLPNKPLLAIAGKSMLQHMFEKAQQSGVDSVLIATDSQEVIEKAQAFGADTCLTAEHHRSGTERIAEAITVQNYDNDDVIVNVQCDEPLLPPVLIKQVADDLLQFPEAGMSTLCEAIINIEDVLDVNNVKVVMDQKGYAIYFSRAPIPWYRDGFVKQTPVLPEEFQYSRHIGLYAYRASFVKKYLALAPSPIEKIEALEQLRVLWHGEKIHVATALKSPGPGVDTEADLEKVRRIVGGS